MKNKLAVIWDMDGVLIDTYAFHYQAWSTVLEDYQIAFSQKTFQRIFGLKNDRAIKMLLGEGVSLEQMLAIEEKKEAAFRQMIQHQVQLLPGVMDWLEGLQHQGVLQAVATSAPPENVNALMAETHIQHYFATIISASEMPGKPDPAVFLEAATRLKVTPQYCLVIEDSVAGLHAAKRAGMKCIAVTTTNPPERLTSANQVVENLTQLSVESFPTFFS
jgi:beta-phosphoglucomutase family hydrolase